MNNEIEVWKDVPNYEGLYQVSSFGRVKSNPRRKTKGGILLPSLNRNKYFQFALYRNGNKKKFQTHQLVAMAFLGHNPDGYKVVVDHIDNNSLNNHVSNLQLISQRENASKDVKNKTSKYVGVYFDKTRGKWISNIVFKKRRINLGAFDNEIDAHKTYQEALEKVNQGLDLNFLHKKQVKSSKYLGVYWSNTEMKWISDYKKKYLGRYEDELKASEAVQNYIKQLTEKKHGN